MNTTRTNELEAILFAAGHGVMKVDILAKMDDLNKKSLATIIEQLHKKYSGESGVVLIETKDSIQLVTNSAYEEIVTDMLLRTRERALSASLLETLSVVAYNQPITKAQIEEVRGGLDCDYALGRLEGFGLIEVVGRLDTVIGRPYLYGTTEAFLKRFSLKSLEDLPEKFALVSKIASIKDSVEEEQELFVERTLEKAYADTEQENVFAGEPETKDAPVEISIEEARRAAGISEKTAEEIISEQEELLDKEAAATEENFIDEE